MRPVKNGDVAAGKLLQALVGQILLRRTKDSTDKSGKRLVDLPTIEYFQATITLDEETRALYDEIQQASAEALLSGQVRIDVTPVALAHSAEYCQCVVHVDQK